MVIDGVECYGSLQDTSNFAVICEDEEVDWIETCYQGPLNWESVVQFIKSRTKSGVIEISAV